MSRPSNQQLLFSRHATVSSLSLASPFPSVPFLWSTFTSALILESPMALCKFWKVSKPKPPVSFSSWLLSQGRKVNWSHVNLSSREHVFSHKRVHIPWCMTVIFKASSCHFLLTLHAFCFTTLFIFMLMLSGFAPLLRIYSSHLLTFRQFSTFKENIWPQPSYQWCNILHTLHQSYSDLLHSPKELSLRELPHCICKGVH